MFVHTEPSTIYVSPDGTGDGSTEETSTELQNALSPTGVIPGDSIILAGGTYYGDYVMQKDGTQILPITISAKAGESPKIDGSLLINGDNVIWRGTEIMYSGWTKRETLIAGSSPSDIQFKTITINGAGSYLEDCIIHDLAQGPGWWADAINSKIRRCIIYNNGWEGPDRGHGHSVYTQNNTGIKTIEDCILFQSFSTGLKIYTEGQYAQGYLCRRNIMFNAAILSSRDDYQMNEWVQDHYGTGYTFEDEHTYHSDPTFDPVRIGLYDGAGGVTLRDCYYPEGLVLHEDTEILENSGGTYTKPESGKHIFVNPVSETKAHVAVYNWDLGDSVVVDLSTVTGLSIGDTVSVKNVQDLFVDIVELVLDADKKITVDMRAVNHTVAAPVLWDAPVTTFPEFGCFIIEKVV